MAVKSFKQHLKSLEEAKPSPRDSIKEQEATLNQVVKEKKITYALMYPENTQTNLYSGECKVTIEDKTETVEIIRGKVLTDNEAIKEALLKRGFIFMYKEDGEKKSRTLQY